MPKKSERKINSVTVEGVTNRDIPYRLRNFAGEERKDAMSNIVVNAKGVRTFCLLLHDDLAERMKADGWNVRELRPKEEGDEPQPFISIKVAFGRIPPKIVVINSSGNKHIMSEDEVYQLNGMDIENADIKIRPYQWESNGKSGIKAYLQTLYVTLAEDELDRKYENMPISAAYQSADDEIPFD